MRFVGDFPRCRFIFSYMIPTRSYGKNGYDRAFHATGSLFIKKFKELVAKLDKYFRSPKYDRNRYFVCKKMLHEGL